MTDLFEYEQMKKCSKCRVISSTTNFHKDKNRKDGLFPQCKLCTKIYYDKNREIIILQTIKYQIDNREKYNIYKREYAKRRRETDLNFRLICNLRSRTYKAFVSQNIRKTNKTLNILNCSQLFFKKWIIYQLYGDMNIQNYGSIWEIDHTIPLSSINLSDEQEVKKCCSWVNLRPMYCKENNSKDAKIDPWLFVLQEVKAKYFKKLNEEDEGYN